MTGRRLVPAVTAGLLVLCLGAGSRPVDAAWSAPGSGAATAAAAVMPTGTAPAASASGSSVTVSWPAATFQNGAAVAGYVIKRYNAINGSVAAVGSGCSGIVTTTSCTEQSVPSGAWIYTDTPVQLTWTGGESSPSNSITV
ncbi:MAG TPA: hypothetical protein VF137_11130 [Candidatus Dormibacteraeota bacterium]